MTRIDKIKLWFYLIFRTLLVVAGIIAVFRQNWTNLGLSLITLFLTFLPVIIKREFRVNSPSEFDIVILGFIYASMYLGEIHSFYERFWWWDLLLHTLSGIIIGTIGFSLVYILNSEENVSMQLSPVLVSVFAFSFALSIGVLWEIFEFTMDSLLGLNMQKSGLVDTMWDLIVDTLGALFVSVLGYLYLKGNVRLFERLENKIAIRQESSAQVNE